MTRLHPPPHHHEPCRVCAKIMEPGELCPAHYYNPAWRRGWVCTGCLLEQERGW